MPALQVLTTDVSVVVVGGAGVGSSGGGSERVGEELKEIGWNRRIRLDPVLLCGVALSDCDASLGDIIKILHERLKHELEVTTQRQEIVSCFPRDYQLSNEEIHALREEDLSACAVFIFNSCKDIFATCRFGANGYDGSIPRGGL
ncbi:hypothetical protein Syun_015114 [Stephania yunnanensis]|uniref:Uncharacterized protein n=1 Tax=Stephania yunnanensis TaxID=152371 RepID=A0AAP0JL31_9MAGN